MEKSRLKRDRKWKKICHENVTGCERAEDGIKQAARGVGPVTEAH